jgi:hypothetical protein
MNISNEKTQHQEVLNTDIFILKKTQFLYMVQEVSKKYMSMFYFFLSF